MKCYIQLENSRDLFINELLKQDLDHVQNSIDVDTSYTYCVMTFIDIYDTNTKGINAN